MEDCANNRSVWKTIQISHLISIKWKSNSKCYSEWLPRCGGLILSVKYHLGLSVQKNIRCKRTVPKYYIDGICCLGSLIYQSWNTKHRTQKAPNPKEQNYAKKGTAFAFLQAYYICQTPSMVYTGKLLTTISKVLVYIKSIGLAVILQKITLCGTVYSRFYISTSITGNPEQCCFFVRSCSSSFCISGLLWDWRFKLFLV